ncbi:hypothetical protein [Pinisolibacter aquiterrae]|uniref:hypothetical protein n=1 Tax=Pinisolibacter aquiterrae TaxID=2815579 RepID=UPI001C3DACC1|nr:hypothetical protein [Pinisolibacter aquiterrae]MBV5262944.1 hypothetical protein [Pinisolibacter aquiterrae]MCC8235285.1 hypothetical protein [Pinisolibacter aquiterrae]
MSFIDMFLAPRARETDPDRQGRGVDATQDAADPVSSAAERRRRRAESEIAVFDAYRRFGIR